MGKETTENANDPAVSGSRQERVVSVPGDADAGDKRRTATQHVWDAAHSLKKARDILDECGMKDSAMVLNAYALDLAEGAVNIERLIKQAH